MSEKLKGKQSEIDFVATDSRHLEASPFGLLRLEGTAPLLKNVLETNVEVVEKSRWH